jgi:hypothetical protein
MKGHLLKQGIFFENCRLVKIDSNGLFKYYYIGKTQSKTAINITSPDVSVRFTYKSQKGKRTQEQIAQ